MDLTEQIAKAVGLKNGSIDLMHNSKMDKDSEKDVFYVCGLFMTKTIAPDVITQFILNYQRVIPYEHTYNRLLKLHNTKDDDGFQMEQKISIALTCGISAMQIKIPVKGRWCEHYDCFDLESYLGTNLQYPKWTCPKTNRDKPIKLFGDEFTMLLLQLAAENDTLVHIDYHSMRAKFNESGLEFEISPKGLV